MGPASVRGVAQKAKNEGEIFELIFNSFSLEDFVEVRKVARLWVYKSGGINCYICGAAIKVGAL